MFKLFIGPSATFVSGQSIAFKMLTNYESRNNILGNHSIFLHNSAGGSVFYKVFYMMFFLIRLLKIGIFQRPSVIYLSISRSLAGFLKDLPVFLLAFICRSKVCVHLHGSDFKDFYRSTSGLVRLLVNFCYRRVSIAFVLSDGMHTEFEDLPDISVITVFNCASDLSILKKPVAVTEQINILYMSNVIKSKGILELIESVDAFNAEGGRVFLKVAGGFVGDEIMSGSEIRKRFFEMIASTDFISYEGVATGRLKEQLFEWANIVALPTYYKTEAQPLVLIEAMSCGRFILSSAFKYIPEFVSDHSNGILLKSVSSDSLLEAFRQIAADNVNYEQVYENNRLHYRENFTESVHCERILVSIKNLI